MDEVRSCPVCGRQGIQAQSSACPQCDADLLCFQALDSLAQTPAASKAERIPKVFLALGLILFFLLCILGGLLLHTKRQLKFLDQQVASLQGPALAEALPAAEEKLPEQTVVLQEQEGIPLTLSNVYKVDAQIKIVNTWEDFDRSQPAIPPEPEQAAPLPEVPEAAEELPKLHAGTVKVPASVPAEPAENNTLAAVQEEEPPARPVVLLQGQPKRRVHKLQGHAQVQVQQAAAPVHSSFVYQAQGGESLRHLAARFYGDERYYPVLMEQNLHLSAFASLRRETPVRVFADKRQAQALYQRKIQEQEGLLLWNYEVRQGETWRSIYARFFPPRYSGRVFYANNPEIIPGKKVQIILR